MAIGDDFSIATNGDIRHVSGSTRYTVLQFHRWLQDLADDAVALANDYLDITNLTPSDRSTDNIIALLNSFNIDDDAAEYLYDGSVTQAGGATIYSGLVVVGSVPASTELQIVQDNATLTSYWSTGLNADPDNNILLRIMVKTRVDGANIDGNRIRVVAREFGDTYSEFTVTMGLGNNTAAIFTGNDLNNATASGTVATWDQFTNSLEGYQSYDVTGEGTPEDYYSRWNVTGGGATPASPTINDLYEYTKYIQRRTTAETIHSMNGFLFRGPTAQWNYDAEGGAQPATNDVYHWGAFLDTGAVTGGPFVVGEKVTGGTSLAYGRVLAVDTVNTSLVVATESGTWASGEVLTGTTSAATATTSAGPVGQALGGGSGHILAVDDNGTTGTVWIQLLKGTNPADNAVTYESTDHTQVMTVDGAPTARTLSPAFIGTSTGTAIIGAFGIGIEPDDLTNSDQLFDLTNTLRQPPANVTFTVAGLESGEDYVLVGPEDGAGGLDYDQLGLNATLNVNSVTTIVSDTVIPSDTPTSGTIRVLDDAGLYRKIGFSSWTGSTFTLALPANAGVQIDVVAAAGTFTRASGSFIDDGFEYGARFLGANFANGGNNANFTVSTVSDDGLTITVTDNTGMVDETGSGDETLTTGSWDFSAAETAIATAANNMFISYIDELAAGTSATFTVVYNADRTLFIRVRDGGVSPIRTFETTGTLGSGGGSTTAIRTSDA